MIIVLSLESLTVSGSLLRERTIIEVIAGFRMHWESMGEHLAPNEAGTPYENKLHDPSNTRR
jgi:hypothetical protein